MSSAGRAWLYGTNVLFQEQNARNYREHLVEWNSPQGITGSTESGSPRDSLRPPADRRGVAEQRISAEGVPATVCNTWTA